MKKWSAVLVTVGAGVLLIAGPAAAEDDANSGQVGVYGTKAPPTQDPEVVSGVLPASPVPAAPVAAAAPLAAPIVVSAAPAASNPLPVTGSDSMLTLQVGAAVLATGGGLLVVSHMRRRTLRTATI